MWLTFDKLKGFPLPVKIKYECLKAFNKLVRLIKPSTFNRRWNEIYEFAWENLKDSQNHVEKIGCEEINQE